MDCGSIVLLSTNFNIHQIIEMFSKSEQPEDRKKNIWSQIHANKSSTTTSKRQLILSITGFFTFFFLFTSWIVCPFAMIKTIHNNFLFSSIIQFSYGYYDLVYLFHAMPYHAIQFVSSSCDRFCGLKTIGYWLKFVRVWPSLSTNQFWIRLFLSTLTRLKDKIPSEQKRKKNKIK